MKRQGGKPAKALGARDGSPTAGGTGRRAWVVAAPLPAVPLGTLGLALGSLKKAGTPGTPSGIMKGITQGDQRRACEQRGEPVPDHLLPKKIELAKGFKKEMMELVKKSKKVAEASSDSEMPEAGKKAEPEKAPSPEEDDESSSSWSYNPKPNRRSDSPMPGKHGPRWKGTPRTVAKVPVGDKQELEVEKYLKSRIKEEEEEDDDEEDSEEPEKAKKKRRREEEKVGSLRRVVSSLMGQVMAMEVLEVVEVVVLGRALLL